MRYLLLIALAAVEAARCACIAVDGEEIRAADLARAIPEFATADGSAILGRVPVAGVPRVFTPRDLLTAASQTGHPMPAFQLRSVCFERAARVLSADDFRAAMLASLAHEHAEIAITDYSRYPVPKGSLVFPLSGLSSPPPAQPDAPVFWRGKLVYGTGRSMEIWAKVRVAVRGSACVALVDLPAAKPIRADQAGIKEVARFPLPENLAIGTVSDIVGRLPKKFIRAGREILARDIVEPREVRAGDRVHVLADCGNARVSMEAIALGDGRKGDSIVVRNPSTRSAFRAVVETRGSVVVHAGRGDRS